MFETPKKIDRNHLRDTPLPGKYCDVERCGNRTVVYIKEYDVCRCAACFQRDVDHARKSSNNKIVEVINQKVSL